MLTNLLANAERLITTQPLIAAPVVFLGGLVTALNPCVLASIPLAVGFVGGYTKGRSRVYAFLLALFLFLGIAAAFTALGLVAGLAGTLFGTTSKFWPVLIIVVCVLMGGQILFFPRFEIPMPRHVAPKVGGMVGAFLLGALTGVIATPCAMPILAVLLSYVASKGSIIYGGLLLFTYALGHSVLVLVAGTSVGIAEAMVSSKGLHRLSAILRKASGVLLLLVAAYFVFELFKR
ncbi:MAG: cytochrome c biogenesis protein CcdA [candidate division WOR-3 bacterium]|nr:MAG: cytochrome c biogenesis protein CcdA [candidate division WOR-3 bacterium]